MTILCPLSEFNLGPSVGVTHVAVFILGGLVLNGFCLVLIFCSFLLIADNDFSVNPVPTFPQKTKSPLAS